MAELHVQPKKKSSILPWLLLLLGIAALIWYLTSRNDDDTTAAAETTTPVTSTSTSNNAASSDWNDVDFNAPAVSYDEISGSDIDVRGNEAYGIYSVGENILFDEGKATIRPDAAASLKQIAASIDKRYASGNIRIYGHTDAQGSAGSNKELAQQRAEAVQAWLSQNGVDASRISLNAIGEANPVATNSTEAGRQQNRRVEIVARAKS